MKRRLSLSFLRSIVPSRYKFRLKAVIVEDGDLWAVQGLEYDIVAQGPTVKEAIESFERVFVAQIIFDLERKRQPFEGIPEAPREFWEMFEQAVSVTPPDFDNFPNIPFNISRNPELRLCA